MIATRVTPRAARSAAVLALAVLAGGCATTASQAPGSPGQKLDPWEGWNRKVFSFNEELDKAVLKPVATAYHDAVPEPARRVVTNVFNNFEDAWSMANNFLQGKVQYGFETGMRVGVNTVFGIGGVVDVATDLGLERHTEDLGQTFGRWGFGPGAYIVWPLLGPSTVRDSIGLPFDLYATSPSWVIHDTGWNWGLSGLHLVNTRANLLGAGNVLNEIALDKYTFVRDAYLQRRRSLVYDGDVPPDSTTPSDDDSGYAPMTVPDAASAPAAASAPRK
ncbi:MAG: VacJ family lipoprotein [Proteobacteria bacterium]|nr:VacJ family lipoprotein [Pseudomonadota bacterium]